MCNAIVLELRAIQDDENVGSTNVELEDSSRGLPEKYTTLLSKLRKKGSKKLLLTWRGSKIPRGVNIPDIGSINWAQNGVLQDEQGVILGYYKRLLEFTGENSDEHKMVITLL